MHADGVFSGVFTPFSDLYFEPGAKFAGASEPSAFCVGASRSHVRSRSKAVGVTGIMGGVGACWSKPVVEVGVGSDEV